MKFCLAFLQIVLSSICIGFAAASSKEVSYVESYLIIGSSCVLEAFNPNDGSFDQEASDDCGECFDRAGYDISEFRLVVWWWYIEQIEEVDDDAESFEFESWMFVIAIITIWQIEINNRQLTMNI